MGILAVAGCLGAGSERARYRVEEVDQVDEGRAVLVNPADGTARVVDARTLPANAGEGDVVVDGRLDPALAAQNRARVRAARSRLVPSTLASGDLLGEGAERDGESR